MWFSRAYQLPEFWCCSNDPWSQEIYEVWILVCSHISYAELLKQIDLIVTVRLPFPWMHCVTQGSGFSKMRYFFIFINSPSSDVIFFGFLSLFVHNSTPTIEVVDIWEWGMPLHVHFANVFGVYYWFWMFATSWSVIKLALSCLDGTAGLFWSIVLLVLRMAWYMITDQLCTKTSVQDCLSCTECLLLVLCYFAWKVFMALVDLSCVDKTVLLYRCVFLQTCSCCF